MTPRRLLANILVLVGCLLTAYEGLGLVTEYRGAVHDPIDPAAPAGLAALDPVDVVAFVAGIVMLMGSFPVGRRQLTPGYLGCVIVALFTASGIAPGGTQGRILLWTVVGIVVLVGVPVFVRAVRRRAADVQRLHETGTLAIGTVVSVVDTGVTVNNSPQVRLRLRVEPVEGGAAFEIETKALVSRLAPPHPGQRYGVVFDPADRSRYDVVSAVDADTPERVRRLHAQLYGGSV